MELVGLEMENLPSLLGGLCVEVNVWMTQSVYRVFDDEYGMVGSRR